MSAKITDLVLVNSSIDNSPIGNTTIATARFVTPANGDNSSNAATTAWVNQAINGMATQSWVNAQLANYATTAYVNSLVQLQYVAPNKIVLPGGFIIMWGSTGGFDTGPVTVNFNYPFPNTCIGVTLTQDGSYSVTSRIWQTTSFSQSGFTCRNNGNGQANWLAFGW